MAGPSAEERQFALVLALANTRSGITKHEILSRVPGYAEKYTPHGDNAAVERQFERDKDDLRAAGIPLEVIDSPLEPENNQESRYRISDAKLAHPREVSFSDEEKRLLAVAGLVWRDGGLSEESQLATLKLRADPDFRADEFMGVLPRQRATESAFDAVKRALHRGQRVQFSYLKPGESASRLRTVEPWALLLFNNRWMLHGRDVEADAPRTFLLRRVVSDVSTKKAAFEVPPGAAAQALQKLTEIWEAATVTICVAPGSDAEIRLAKRADSFVDGETITIHHSDGHVVAEELVSFGPDVVVQAPERIRNLVADRLDRLIALHSEPSSTEEEHS
ncbi:helix-turn-helix transcriptional regulator [Humidisolicoccus flavus]|uniref:helix-turn-helix transcriptional regulator n=1 Tax=Humidisolicoccus flavus TaxID=3111414 RepID=UPI0032472C99